MTDEEILARLQHHAAIAAQSCCSTDSCYDFAMGRLYDEGVKIDTAGPVATRFLGYCCEEMETPEHSWIELPGEPATDMCNSCGAIRR